MTRFAARRLEDIPRVADVGDDPRFHAVQHHFGLTAFGVNAFVAQNAGAVLVEEHDERASGQEELYVVLEGLARFELDGEPLDAPAGTFVAIPDETTRRRALAVAAGTTLLAIGAPRDRVFSSTWSASHFAGVPQV